MAYILEISKSNNKLWLNLIPVVEAIRKICMIKQNQKRTIKAGRQHINPPLLPCQQTLKVFSVKTQKWIEMITKIQPTPPKTWCEPACMMLFLLSGRSSPIFENVSQNNVLEKSRKMKIFHILDSWSKSKTYWQNGQSLCHLICKSRNRFAMGVGGGDGGIILFTISVALNFSRGGCPNLYSPLNQGITCTWQTLTLLRCMVS